MFLYMLGVFKKRFDNDKMGEGMETIRHEIDEKKLNISFVIAEKPSIARHFLHWFLTSCHTLTYLHSCLSSPRTLFHWHSLDWRVAKRYISKNTIFMINNIFMIKHFPSSFYNVAQVSAALSSTLMHTLVKQSTYASTKTNYVSFSELQNAYQYFFITFQGCRTVEAIYFKMEAICFKNN